jgi:alpha-L-fucosidase
MPGDVVESELPVGTRFVKYWMPAECDVSIRPGWFWHEAENSKVKTPKELFDLYMVSVGRGASFLLNVPPDSRGRLHEADAESLRAFGKWKREIFGTNLAGSAKLQGLTLGLSKPATFNLVRLREDISKGQRVGAFSVEYSDAGVWKTFGSGTSIGMGRILRSDTTVTASKVRLKVEQASGPVELSEFSLFRAG